MNPEADRILTWIGWVVQVQLLLVGVQVLNTGLLLYLLVYGDPWWVRGTMLVSVAGIGASVFGWNYQQRLGRALDDIVREQINQEYADSLRQARHELDDYIQHRRYR